MKKSKEKSEIFMCVSPGKSVLLLFGEVFSLLNVFSVFLTVDYQPRGTKQ